MKNFLITLISCCLVLTPSLMFAASASDNLQKNEITALNNLSTGKSLLMHSGGKCWQTCADDDYGKLNCVTTCDEDGNSQGYTGGGGGGELTPERMIFLGVAAVAIGILCWYLIQGSINAGNSV